MPAANAVWDDGLRRTFIGFDKDNKLFVGEGTTKAEADALGIRDAVAFQTGNVLITNDGENVTYYYADSNTGVAQRTAIAQLADGTVIFLVTDGRTASSMGATKKRYNRRFRVIRCGYSRNARRRIINDAVLPRLLQTLQH